MRNKKSCMKTRHNKRSNKRRNKRSNKRRNKKGGGKQIIITTDSHHRLLLVAHLDDTYCNTPEDAKEGLAFEYSSGRSNLGQNFPNTFLPIKYVREDCYMKKSGDLYKFELYDGFFITGTGVKEKADLSIFIDKVCPSAKQHLEFFIDRFGCWKELQISAALGGGRDARSAWQVFSYFRNLRRFALSHNYDISTRTFIPRSEEINIFDWKTSGWLPFAPEYDPTCDHIRINKWLKDNGVNIAASAASAASASTAAIVLKLDGTTYSRYRNKVRNTDYNLSTIQQPEFEVELPKEINEMLPENVNSESLKDLKKIVSDMNLKLKGLKDKIITEISEINKRDPLDKYMSFVKYSINREQYIDDDNKYYKSLIEVLTSFKKKIHRLYNRK
jgi:hypothetical protein